MGYVRLVSNGGRGREDSLDAGRDKLYTSRLCEARLRHLSTAEEAFNVAEKHVQQCLSSCRSPTLCTEVVAPPTSET